MPSWSEGSDLDPESWLPQQMQCDLWRAQHNPVPVEIRRFAAA